MRSFTGYISVEQIDETLHSVVYRARRDGESGTVVIKALKGDNPAPSEIARLKHEYGIIRSIPFDGIVNVLDIIEQENTVAIVLEDFHGTSLREFIREGFSLERFLEMGLRISLILGNLHQNNITHRDIKPGNILINPAEGMVKITDFGIAAEVSRVNEEIYNPTVIEGTLAYISPEQTGRINCPVDYRSDLYSLGVTFYEMLTGSVPFMAKDPLEIIHAHIAKAPVPPRDLKADIPQVLSDIVMKLLAKAPEERYQNSFGLMHDLKDCLDQLKTSGSVLPFELGRKDMSLKFNIPQVVVGRDEDLALLHTAFDRVSAGAVELMLVTGEPGIGKSALVGEVRKPIVARKGYFITGKYDQLRRYVPYSAIIQAFQGLARQLLTESTERIVEWKAKLLEAFGPNGRIITDAIPEVELIVGSQPDIPELGIEETQNRFTFVFKNFVKVFANASHPLVLFLDDLQWADSASLSLIQAMSTDRSLSHFLLIGAYRDNEVGAHHPFLLTLEEIIRKNVTVSNLKLSPLSAMNVNRIIANFLRCGPDVSSSLSAVVHEKTLGNPFFVIQFLKTLYEEKHLVFDALHGWQWDADVIEEMQVTDNVVVLMADKISRLPAAPRDLIEVCACIGNRFDVETLADTLERSSEDVLESMDELIKQGLISYSKDLYRFHHDRIQEAAYSLLDQEERERIHYRIGNLGLKKTPPEELFNYIFYITDQLNKGRRHMVTREERTRLADLNLKAGIRAKDSTAYGPAVSYLASGMELLAEDSWRTDYAITYGLFTEQMECQYLNRNFEEAERLFKIIVSNAATKRDKAKAYTTMVVLYTNLRSAREAIELGLRGLKLFGFHTSIDVGQGPVLVDLVRAKLALRKIPLEKIPDLPRMEDEDMLAFHELMLSVGTPAYYVNPNLFAVLTLKGVNDALTYGLLPHSAAAFLTLASIIQSGLGDYELGYRLGETALKLNDRLDNRKSAGLVHHIFAFFIQHWTKPIRLDLDIYPKAYELALNAGNFIIAGHSITATAETRIRLNHSLDDILADLRKYREFMNVLKDPLITSQYQSAINFVLALKGQTPGRCSLSAEGFDMEEFSERLKNEGNFFGMCFAFFPKIFLRVLYGRSEEALPMAEELDRYIHIPMGSLLVPEHYVLYSLILADLLGKAGVREGLRYRALIRRNQRKMKRWAEYCPENFLNKYLLVEGAVMAATGRFREAVDLFHQSIENAKKSGHLLDEAMAYERLAALYLSGNCRYEGRTFLKLAHQTYTRWGATAKVKDLEENHPFLTDPEHLHSIPDFTATGAGATSNQLDLATVMQVSQAISGEIVLERLLGKIMKLAIVNAGAQKGFFILDSDGRLTIEAAGEEGREEVKVMQSVPIEGCRDLSNAIVHYVYRSGETVLLGNASRSGPYQSDPYVMRNRCKSILATPVMSKGKAFGILYMENNLATNAFTPERLELLRIISTQAAISLENARLFELATNDGLTKLFVHRYFQLLLDQEIERSLRSGKPFSLVMMDIDDFKSFNDTYGHQLGDEVLRRVARAVKAQVRSVDIAARYGGEEFVLILPETDTPGALAASEKVRKAVEELSIPFCDEALGVTISLGLATFPVHAGDKDALIRSADNGLYAAKRSGKNRTCVEERSGLQRREEPAMPDAAQEL